MRAYKRKVLFSACAVLESLWTRKRLKTPAFYVEFPGLSTGVLFRTLRALREAGLVRAYLTPSRAKAGRPAQFWKPTARGLETLKVLLPYRDVWWVLDNRDMVGLAAGVKMLGKLEAMRQEFFPDGKPIDARANYLRRSRENFGS